MSEEEFRATLDPVAIVKNRATVGGPQPKEMERMIKAAGEKVAMQETWAQERKRIISTAMQRLDEDFGKLAKSSQ